MSYLAIVQKCEETSAITSGDIFIEINWFNDII